MPLMGFYHSQARLNQARLDQTRPDQTRHDSFDTIWYDTPRFDSVPAGFYSTRPVRARADGYTTTTTTLAPLPVGVLDPPPVAKIGA